MKQMLCGSALVASLCTGSYAFAYGTDTITCSSCVMSLQAEIEATLRMIHKELLSTQLWEIDIVEPNELIDGSVYRVISMQPEDEVCIIHLKEEGDNAEEYPKTLAQHPAGRPIVVFLPWSEEPVHFFELWLGSYDCLPYDNLNIH